MKVTVSYPITFEFPDDQVTDEIFDTQERIKDMADQIFQSSSIDPIITSAENEDYEE